MLRWILKEHDSLSVFKHYAVNEAVIQAQLSQGPNIEQPFWFCVSDQAFRAFFTKNYLRPEDIQADHITQLKKDLQKAALPSEMVAEIRRLIAEEGLTKAKFSVRLTCDSTKKALSHQWLREYCEMSARNGEGILQAIKGCWISLLDRRFMNKLWDEELTLADIKVGLIISVQQEYKEYGRVYSVSPRCLWDRSNLVVTLLKTQPPKDYIEANSQEIENSYLVDKENLTVTFYGKNIHGDSFVSQEKGKTKVSDPMSFDKVKKIAKAFLIAEKTMNEPLVCEWAGDAEGKIIFHKWDFYADAPHSGYYQGHLNNPSRHFWFLSQFADQSELCLPYWFSLVVRNMRPMTLQLLQKLGLKKYLTADYEKVFRMSVGILRGRMYINMGAIQRLLSLLPYDSLATELDNQLGQWQRKFDKEMRVFWDGPLPEMPKIKKSDLQDSRKSFKKTKKTFAQQEKVFLANLEQETLHLYDFKWEQKNLTESFNEIRKIEQRMMKIMMPILFNEIEYWSMKSYVHQLRKNTTQPSWFCADKDLHVQSDGSWFERKRAEKLEAKWQAIQENRVKHNLVLEKYFGLLKRRIDNMGSKFVSLGLLRKSSDIFYLTQEEILSFEEGRLTSINLKGLIALRHDEYRQYARDEKIPQVWLTMGLVGLAEKYPSVMTIREYKNNVVPAEEGIILQAPEQQSNSVINELVEDMIATPSDQELLEIPKNENFMMEMVSPLASSPVFIDELRDRYDIIENEEFVASIKPSSMDSAIKSDLEAPQVDHL